MVRWCLNVSVCIKNVLILSVCLRNDRKLGFHFVLLVVVLFFKWMLCLSCANTKTSIHIHPLGSRCLFAHVFACIHFCISTLYKKKASLNGIVKNAYTVFLPVCVLRCSSPCWFCNHHWLLNPYINSIGELLELICSCKFWDSWSAKYRTQS